MNLVLILISAGSFLIDRLVKYWARTDLKASDASLPLWRGVFQFTYMENRGAAFGMLQGRFWLFFVLTLGVCGYIVFKLFISRNKLPRTPSVALALILGGALGNFYDRLVYGYVVDMFDFCLIHFAVFNFADSCVVVGTLLFCLWALLLEGRKERWPKAAGDPDGDDR